METFYLPENFRKKLKEIWGIPILGTEQEIAKRFKEVVENSGFKKIITVGDYCSQALDSDVKIFDGKIKRKEIKNTLPFSLTCPNPAGTIQKEVWSIIERAIEANENIFIEGEEDLLVIPAVLLSEENTVVVYGLPDRGICLIRVDPETKATFKQVLEGFETR